MKSKYLLLLGLIVALSTIASASNPVVEIVSPTNNATDVELTNGNVNLRVNVTDDDGDLAFIAFQTNKSGTWTDIATVYTSGDNWTSSMPVVFSNLDAGTTYYWRVKAKDDTNNWHNITSKFTTSGEDEEEPDEEATIELIPSEPRAGRKMLFLTNLEDATGYVFCYETDNVYLFEITNGLGIVELNIEEHGEAIVNIPKYTSKTFEIASPYEGDLVIDAPANADMDEGVEVSVFARGERISTSLKMISPTGRETYETTSDTMPVEVSFSEPGNWTLKTDLYNTVATTNIYINPEPLDIDIQNDCCLQINQEVVIEINGQADVRITKDEMSWDYDTDGDGYVYFTPPQPGRYKVTANSIGQSGTEYFTVKSNTNIWVKNEKGYQVSDISEGDILFIQITDDLGNSIPGSYVRVYAGDMMSGQSRELPLSGGSAIWKVDMTAETYTFEFYPTDTEQYMSSTTTVPGSQSLPMTYIIIAVVIVIIIIFLYVLHRKGYDILSYIPFLRRKEDWEEDLL